MLFFGRLGSPFFAWVCSSWFFLILLEQLWLRPIGKRIGNEAFKKQRRKDRSSSVFPPARSCESNWQRSSSQSSATTHANVE